MSFILLLSTGCGMTLSGAGFSRYNLILERRPFAAVVPADEENGSVVTVVVPPAFVKDLKMVAITESPAGIKVGFMNVRIKPPQPYYLYVGDSEDGIELVDASYEKEGALLRKGGEQFWMYMGAAPAVEAASPVTAKRSGVPAPPGFMRSKSGPGSAISKAQGSYAERRRKRLEEMRQRAAKARELSEAEVEQKLQKYQMDLIRKGLTPLPIKLTDETDRQLVKEGFLPPLEGDE